MRVAMRPTTTSAIAPAMSSSRPPEPMSGSMPKSCSIQSTKNLPSYALGSSDCAIYGRGTVGRAVGIGRGGTVTSGDAGGSVVGGVFTAGTLAGGTLSGGTVTGGSVSWRTDGAGTFGSVVMDGGVVGAAVATEGWPTDGATLAV